MHLLRYALLILTIIAFAFVLVSPEESISAVSPAAMLAIVQADDEDADEEEAEEDEEEPTEVIKFEDPADILEFYPAFEVPSRIEYLEDDKVIYPCSDCHDNDTQLANPRVRELEEEHWDLTLNHGEGRFWCMTCHDLEDRDTLVSLDDKAISFDESHLLCGQCHFDRQRDFFMGGHGKRIGTWQGERTLTPCVECHNPHAPEIKTREPLAAPTLRPGLPEQEGERHHPKKPWQKIAEDRGFGNPDTPEEDH